MTTAASRPDGILLLDKPLGLSSTAAGARVRRLLGADRAGHVGSLDPLATGMLPICLGEATKVAGAIVEGEKLYEFRVQLRAATATGDAEGAVIATAPVPELSRPAVEAVLAGFVGVQQQVPPMYSAIKREGQPLYRLARAGITVERAAREIRIVALDLLGLDPAAARLDLRVRCSKGTYVRVLAEDLARALGTVGHVVLLRRTALEPFWDRAMVTLEDVERRVARGEAVPLLPADEALPGVPQVRLAPPEVLRLLQGQAVPVDGIAAAPLLRLYAAADGDFLGLGYSEGDGRVRPRRLRAACGKGGARV